MKTIVLLKCQSKFSGMLKLKSTVQSPDFSESFLAKNICLNPKSSALIVILGRNGGRRPVNNEALKVRFGEYYVNDCVLRYRSLIIL